MAKAMGLNRKQFDNIARYTGTVAGVQTAGAEGTGLVENNAATKAAAKAAGFGDNVTGYLESQSKKRGEAKDVQIMNDIVRTQQDTAFKMDNAVNIFNGAVSRFAGLTSKGGSAAGSMVPGSSNGSTWGGVAASSSSAPSGAGMTGLEEYGNFGVDTGSTGGGKIKASGRGMDGSKLDARLEGLNVRNYGDVHRKDSDLDPRLLELAKKVQTGIDGFEVFTSFNDKHHADKNSKHNVGKAIDFTLHGGKPTREQGELIVSKLKEMGFSYAQDEYNNPSRGATAGHIHAQIARNGGIFKGPTTGYNVELHGEEAVVPLNRGNHVSKQTLPVGIGGDSSGESNQRMVSLLQTIVDQNSTVISLLDNSNDYSRKLVNVMS
jgi:hypothetical protein